MTGESWKDSQRGTKVNWDYALSGGKEVSLKSVIGNRLLKLMTITHPERFVHGLSTASDPTHQRYLLSDLISPIVSTCGVKVWTITFCFRRGLASFIPQGLLFI